MNYATFPLGWREKRRAERIAASFPGVEKRELQGSTQYKIGNVVVTFPWREREIRVIRTIERKEGK